MRASNFLFPQKSFYRANYISAAKGLQISYKARSIPAWGNAPGKRTNEKETRAKGPPHVSMSRGSCAVLHSICLQQWQGPHGTGLQPFVFHYSHLLGRCPRLVWNAPSALIMHVILIYIISSFVLKIMFELMRMVRDEVAERDEIRFDLHSKSTAVSFTRAEAA
jgi:hypothetical protein